MDVKIVEILKKQYRLTNLEIADMVNIAPMLDVTTFAEFTDCCKLLVKYGYPKSDLDFLFLANPNIFVQSAADLEIELKKLLQNYDDLEIALKEDPLLI